jgi:hypothetical protein
MLHRAPSYVPGWESVSSRSRYRNSASKKLERRRRKKARNPVTLQKDWTELTSAAAFLLGEVSTVWRLAKYIVSNRAHSIAV